MQTIQDRLEEICNAYFGGKISTMAAYYETPQPTLYHNIKDNTSVSYTLLRNIAMSREFPVNAEWLLTGLGEMRQVGSRAILFEEQYLSIIRDLMDEIKDKQKTIHILQSKI